VVYEGCPRGPKGEKRVGEMMEAQREGVGFTISALALFSSEERGPDLISLLHLEVGATLARLLDQRTEQARHQGGRIRPTTGTR
jgi:hypothetical protein